MNTAIGLALGILLASLLFAGLPARADSTQAYPNPDYPNHKPLRGAYPGTYSSTAAAPTQPDGGEFDWRASAVGAAGMLGLILLLAAGRASARTAGSRRRAKLTAVPALALAVLIGVLVLEIPGDDSPTAATQQPAAQADQRDADWARRITQMYTDAAPPDPDVAVRPQTGTPDEDGIR